MTIDCVGFPRNQQQCGLANREREFSDQSKFWERRCSWFSPTLVSSILCSFCSIIKSIWYPLIGDQLGTRFFLEAPTCRCRGAGYGETGLEFRGTNWDGPSEVWEKSRVKDICVRGWWGRRAPGACEWKRSFHCVFCLCQRSMGNAGPFLIPFLYCITIYIDYARSMKVQTSCAGEDSQVVDGVEVSDIEQKWSRFLLRSCIREMCSHLFEGIDWATSQWTFHQGAAQTPACFD